MACRRAVRLAGVQRRTACGARPPPCRLRARAGFVLVKKVPGTLHFGARSEGHSFDHEWLNMTHVVHSFNLGSRPTLKKYRQLQVRTLEQYRQLQAAAGAPGSRSTGSCGCRVGMGAPWLGLARLPGH